MHAKLVTLAARPGCEAVDANNVRCPQGELSNVFQMVTAITATDDGYDFTADGADFVVTRVSGERINVVED